MKFTEAKNAAEIEGTEKSKNFRKVARSAIVALVVIIILIISTVMVANWKKSPEHQQKQSAGSQPARSTERVLLMPANGDSSRITPPPEHAVTFTGDGFTTHCVYTDGRKGIVGDPVHPCGNGPMLYVFVHDKTGKANTVSYEYVRPN